MFRHTNPGLFMSSPYPFSRLGLLVLLPVLLTGCPAQKLFHEGQDLEARGKDYSAADKYLDALDTNPKLKKPREALGTVAEAAYKEKLEIAQGHEQQANYPDALAEYRKIRQLLDRLKSEDLITFDVIDARTKIGEMENAAAEQQYKIGEAALQARRWEAAVAGYTESQRFKDGYKDTADKVALAQYSWGDDEFTAARHRSAAEHYLLATQSAGPGFKDAAKKAGNIYAALGHHFIGADRCRQAVKDLRRAAPLVTSEAIAADTAKAEECAITPVAILPFENPTGQTLAGMALGDTISDGIGSWVSGHVSEFVHLVDRSALDQILAEQGLSATGVASGSTSKLRGVRYLVVGKITQVRSDKPAMTNASRTVAGKLAYDCQKTKNDGTTYNGTCYNEVQLSYVEHAQTESVVLVGSVKVVDVKTGEQIAAAALEGRATDAIKYADGFMYAGTNNPAVVEGNQGGVNVSNEVAALAKSRTTLKDEGELTKAVLERVVGTAADVVVKAVDIEKEATDPSTLVIASVK